MILFRKIFAVTLILAITYLSHTQILAGNQNSRALQNNKNYLIYLVGGPTTNKVGLENLKNALKIKFCEQGLQLDVHTLFPYSNMEQMYIRSNLKRFNCEKEKIGQKIISKMNLERITSETAVDTDTPENDTELTIIAHGWGAIGAIRAAEILSDEYNCEIKNLILIGAPKLPISHDNLRMKTCYIYHTLDPMTDVGNWFINETGSTYSPAKHIPVDVHYPEGHFIGNSQINNFTMNAYRHIDSNNYYFFEDSVFKDEEGVSNLKKTVESFFNDSQFCLSRSKKSNGTISIFKELPLSGNPFFEFICMFCIVFVNDFVSKIKI